MDEAMLAATGVKQDAIGERRVPLTDPYSQEKAQLVGLIGRALGWRAVRHPGHDRGQIIAVTICECRCSTPGWECSRLVLAARYDPVTIRPLYACLAEDLSTAVAGTGLAHQLA